MKRERRAASVFGRFLARSARHAARPRHRDQRQRALQSAHRARMLAAAVKSGFAIFSERPLRVVDVRRMDSTVDQSRVGGISGSGVL